MSFLHAPISLRNGNINAVFFYAKLQARHAKPDGAGCVHPLRYSAGRHLNLTDAEQDLMGLV